MAKLKETTKMTDRHTRNGPHKSAGVYTREPHTNLLGGYTSNGPTNLSGWVEAPRETEFDPPGVAAGIGKNFYKSLRRSGKFDFEAFI